MVDVTLLHRDFCLHIFFIVYLEELKGYHVLRSGWATHLPLWRPKSEQECNKAMFITKERQILITILFCSIWHGTRAKVRQSILILFGNDSGFDWSIQLTHWIAGFLDSKSGGVSQLQTPP